MDHLRAEECALMCINFSQINSSGNENLAKCYLALLKENKELRKLLGCDEHDYELWNSHPTTEYKCKNCGHIKRVED